MHGLYGMLTVLRAYYASSTGGGWRRWMSGWGSGTGTPPPASTMWLSSSATIPTRGAGIISQPTLHNHELLPVRLDPELATH